MKQIDDLVLRQAKIEME